MPSLTLLSTLFLMHAQAQLALRAVSAHGWVMFSILFTSIPKSFYPGLLSIHSLSSCCFCFGLPWPKALHLALLSFRFAQCLLSNLPLDDTPSLQPVNCTVQLSVVDKLAESSLKATIHVAIKMLKIPKYPKTKPWGMPPVTGLQLDIEPFTTTLWVRPLGQFLSNQVVCLSNQWLCSLQRKMSCGAVSIALH